MNVIDFYNYGYIEPFKPYEGAVLGSFRNRVDFFYDAYSFQNVRMFLKDITYCSVIKLKKGKYTFSKSFDDYPTASDSTYPISYQEVYFFIEAYEGAMLLEQITIRKDTDFGTHSYVYSFEFPNDIIIQSRKKDIYRIGISEAMSGDVSGGSFYSYSDFDFPYEILK